ncbi:nucleoside hydrolase [Jannaschia sp. CCS1]|uniref:nucleoside hydrolase n=1 Tax=Jannaschia sp. (strain CCS1) TaxID=290400 RepID=UPI000053D4A0|nr:nucleoside hydrolase [Jannaschia sp. CCS1]ABD56157.1 Inosine/uridine-preferring nucleoside hydrolase [Jannaschia sp. CCS1]
MTRPVLIDTDPGLDDAVGILMALADPRLDVRAVTSVAGNIGIATTTRNVGHLLAAAGRDDIAYAAGAAGPLTGDELSEEAIHGADGLGGVTLPDPLKKPDPGGAVSLLAERLLDAPEGTVTILALGPLTNLALLSRDAPEAYGRISRIIAMGGTIYQPGNVGPHTEFNMAADPMAAQMVFHGPVPVTLIPLDVTRKLRATPADLDRLAACGAPAATLAADLIRAYFAGNTDRTSRPLHDPCVMLMAVVPQLFGTHPLRLTVDQDHYPGRLVQSPDGSAIDVAMTIDAAAALDMLWHGLGTAT